MAIDWSIDRAGDGEPTFAISWQESGGPVVQPPEREGFGGRIIRDVPRAKLRGEVEVDYAAAGFRPPETFVATAADGARRL